MTASLLGRDAQHDAIAAAVLQWYRAMGLAIANAIWSLIPQSCCEASTTACNGLQQDTEVEDGLDAYSICRDC